MSRRGFCNVPALVEHGARHPVRHPLILEVENILGFKAINGPRILDIADDDLLADLGAGQFYHIGDAVRQPRGLDGDGSLSINHRNFGGSAANQAAEAQKEETFENRSFHKDVQFSVP